MQKLVVYAVDILANEYCTWIHKRQQLLESCDLLIRLMPPVVDHYVNTGNFVPEIFPKASISLISNMYFDSRSLVSLAGWLYIHTNDLYCFT